MRLFGYILLRHDDSIALKKVYKVFADRLVAKNKAERDLKTYTNLVRFDLRGSVILFFIGYNMLSCLAVIIRIYAFCCRTGQLSGLED